jgi:undecaprenyl diphosphate synthase
LGREVAQLQKDGVRLHFVGSREGLSERVSRGLRQAEASTANNSTLVLNVCFNYGGRWDIATAAARLASSGITITEQTLAGELSLAHCPDPDLVIRTGGEQRLSNFLLWQAAYAELYFSDVLWPDFNDAALDAALLDYASRERRFGKTSSQLGDQSHH